MVNQVQVRRLNTISYEIRSTARLYRTRTLCRMSARPAWRPSGPSPVSSCTCSCILCTSPAVCAGPQCDAPAIFTRGPTPCQQYSRLGRNLQWAKQHVLQPQLPNDCIAGLSAYTVESFKMQPKETRKYVNGCHRAPQTSQKDTEKGKTPSLP